jgi:hypothetical protein
MNYFEKLKTFIMALDHEISQEDAEANILVINNERAGICDLILDCEDDLLIIEQAIFPVKNDSPELYESILKMNRRLIHGAFVLNTLPQGDIISFRDTLQLENLDCNELEGSLNSLAFALVENLNEILRLAN